MTDFLVTPSALGSYTEAFWGVVSVGGPIVGIVLAFNLFFFVVGLWQESVRDRHTDR